MAAKSLRIVNVQSDIGSIYAGKSRAPAAFQSAGLQEKLKNIGFQVDDSTASSGGPFGWKLSKKGPNGARNEAGNVEACKQVFNAVTAGLNDQERLGFQLILSGECMYCPAILSAYWKHLEGTSKRVGILYMDADCDMYTPIEPGASGNVAGMTGTHMTLREGSLESMKVFSRVDGSGVVDSSNIVFYGLNSGAEVNKREHLGYLFDNHFRVVTSQAVQKEPVKRAQEALRWLEERVDYIVVHLDVDVIDPGEFPLCNVPSWTGLGFEETMASLKVFLKSEKTVALSLAEVNPDHDPGLEMTGRLVDEIVDGLSWCGYCKDQ